MKSFNIASKRRLRGYLLLCLHQGRPGLVSKNVVMDVLAEDFPDVASSLEAEMEYLADLKLVVVSKMGFKITPVGVDFVEGNGVDYSGILRVEEM